MEPLRVPNARSGHLASAELIIMSVREGSGTHRYAPSRSNSALPFAVVNRVTSYILFRVMKTILQLRRHRGQIVIP